MSMGSLSELPNIGKAMEKRLVAIGINDIETLKKIGSKEAFIKLKIYEGDTCINSLYALEGAIQGIRWHDLSSESKEDLKAFYNSF